MRALPFCLNAAAACRIVFSACWLRFERSQSKNTMNDGGVTTGGGGGRRGHFGVAELVAQAQQRHDVVVEIGARIGRPVVAAFHADAHGWRCVVAKAQDALLAEHREDEVAALEVGMYEGTSGPGARFV